MTVGGSVGLDAGNRAGLREVNGGRGEGSDGDAEEEEDDDEEEEEDGGVLVLMAVKMLGVTEAKGEGVTLGVKTTGRGENDTGLGEVTTGMLVGVSLRGVKEVLTKGKDEVKVLGGAGEVKVPWPVIRGMPEGEVTLVGGRRVMTGVPTCGRPKKLGVTGET